MSVDPALPGTRSPARVPSTKNLKQVRPIIRVFRLSGGSHLYGKCAIWIRFTDVSGFDPALKGEDSTVFSRSREHHKPIFSLFSDVHVPLFSMYDKLSQPPCLMAVPRPDCPPR